MERLTPKSQPSREKRTSFHFGEGDLPEVVYVEPESNELPEGSRRTLRKMQSLPSTKSKRRELLKKNTLGTLGTARRDPPTNSDGLDAISLCLTGADQRTDYGGTEYGDNFDNYSMSGIMQNDEVAYLQATAYSALSSLMSPRANAHMPATFGHQFSWYCSKMYGQDCQCYDCAYQSLASPTSNGWSEIESPVAATSPASPTLAWADLPKHEPTKDAVPQKIVLDGLSVASPDNMSVASPKSSATKKSKKKKELKEHEKTTSMLRNIPNKYEQGKLLKVMADKGFDTTTFDFFYLPIDFRNNCCVGYAFINFRTHELAVEFEKAFTDFKLPMEHASPKICQVNFARIQGRQANIDVYRNSALAGIQKKEYKPLCFEPNGQEIDLPMPDAPLPEVQLRAAKIHRGSKRKREKAKKLNYKQPSTWESPSGFFPMAA